MWNMFYKNKRKGGLFKKRKKSLRIREYSKAPGVSIVTQIITV